MMDGQPCFVLMHHNSRGYKDFLYKYMNFCCMYEWVRPLTRCETTLINEE